MRYLNKVVFINSASIAYAEIGLSGNVHFIGTQGVGKSTCLRAILFFYNADKIRLGIEKGKRSFDDYYLPHANSFIVYEVITETGPFCVIVYRSQGRAAFRFIDAAYNKENFIGSGFKAMVWEQIRNTFPQNLFYSRKVERYEEYRDIIYGNNKGLPSTFRKYALIESKSYLNLPRTIQNVFLNSKLEAEFIKQTIIMSLSEEDVRIDLDQYSLHLRNFEQQLADIGKWSEQNKSGEIVVRELAAKISSLHKIVGFLSIEKRQLIQSLINTHRSLEQMHPLLVKRLDQQQAKYVAIENKLKDSDEKFQERKDNINKEITLMAGKISDARRKNQEYQLMDITSIIDRISKKALWENKKNNLHSERNLLSFRYQEIMDKYTALQQQLNNQLDQFVNEKNKEGNNLKSDSYLRKDTIRKQYEKISADIVLEQADIKHNAEMKVVEKTQSLHQFELQRKAAEFKRWFEDELKTEEQIIAKGRQELVVIRNERVSNRKQIESLQKSWGLDEKTVELDFDSKKTNLEELIISENRKIEKCTTILADSSNSFFGWLNENKPGWEENIGKVINEQSILFNSGLTPRSVSVQGNLLYGVELDLSQVEYNVKTIADYELDIRKSKEDIELLQAKLAAITEKNFKEKGKIKKIYQTQIKVLKDLISVGDYNETKINGELDKAVVNRDEWIRKAQETQKTELEKLKTAIINASEEKAIAEEQLLVVQKNIYKRLDEKKRERDHKILEVDQTLVATLDSINVTIAEEKNRIQRRKEHIEGQQKRDLENDGADVVRIAAIDVELASIEQELNYIEVNRDKLAEYNKDKRELFDRVDEFKEKKKLAEVKLSGEQERHMFAKTKLQERISDLRTAIAALELERRETLEDLEAFENFTKTDLYLSMLSDVPIIEKDNPVSIRLTKIIASIHEKINESTARMTDLRGNINRFLSNFSTGNIFGFETILVDDVEYRRFADNLSEFLEENKIEEYERRTNELFGSLISQIGKETTELVSKEAIINKVINDINRDFVERNFAGVIKGIELRMTNSASKIVTLLQELRVFNDEYALSLGKANLFSNEDTAQNNKKAVMYLKSFAQEIAASKQSEVSLSDTFELQFKIVENDNDSGWVEKLTNVGSEGTDVLVKAMINIMLLNVFKENASRKFKDFRLHCMMDEIGKLHPNNVKGILKFANDRNIVLINSSPTSYSAIDYKHTYLLSKDKKHTTIVKRLITNNQTHGN